MSDRAIREAHGLQWWDRGPDTDDHLVRGHEDELRPIANALLPDGGGFVDVGAHIGIWSLPLALKAGNVWAFEANPNTFQALCDNIALNTDRLKARIFTQNCAIWDRSLLVRYKDWNGKESGGSTACYEADQPNVVPGDQTYVWAQALDTFFSNAYPVKSKQPKIDLIKIDTEGAEARVLHGAADTIRQFQPALMIEMHGGIQNVPMSVDDEVLDLLRRWGYEWGSEIFASGGRHIVATPYQPWQEGEKV